MLLQFHIFNSAWKSSVPSIRFLLFLFISYIKFVLYFSMISHLFTVEFSYKASGWLRIQSFVYKNWNITMESNARPRAVSITGTVNAVSVKKTAPALDLRVTEKRYRLRWSWLNQLPEPKLMPWKFDTSRQGFHGNIPGNAENLHMKADYFRYSRLCAQFAESIVH